MVLWFRQVGSSSTSFLLRLLNSAEYRLLPSCTPPKVLCGAAASVPLRDGNLWGCDKQPPSSGVGLTEHKKPFLFCFIFCFFHPSFPISLCCASFGVASAGVCFVHALPRAALSHGWVGGSAARWERDEVEMGLVGWVPCDLRPSAALGHGGG